MATAGHSANDPAVGRALELLSAIERKRTDEPLVATAGTRIVSRLVDFALVLVFLVILGGITTTVSLLVFPWGAPNGGPREVSLGEWIFAGAAGVVAVAGLLANEVVFVGRTGQTLGKKAMGIFVVDAGGRPPRYSTALIRLLVWTVPLLACLGLWGLVIGDTALSLAVWGAALASLVAPLWLVAGPEHRGLHDRLCGTRVIEPR